MCTLGADSPADKAALRQRMLELRRTLPPDEAAQRSVAIMERLLESPVMRNAETLLTYVASKDNEVDTRPLIGRLLTEHRRVLVPVTLPGRQLAWARIAALDDLTPSRFGVLEPREHLLRLEDPSPGALCMVPGIAFDPDGYRIGYGGGYFDRFLSACEVYSIGLAYDLQILDSIPRDPWDRPVNKVLTETAWFPKV
jgi:5-formyltetrahydrofolate cyclo-ligase